MARIGWVDGPAAARVAEAAVDGDGACTRPSVLRSDLTDFFLGDEEARSVAGRA